MSHERQKSLSNCYLAYFLTIFVKIQIQKNPSKVYFWFSLQFNHLTILTHFLHYHIVRKRAYMGNRCLWLANVVLIDRRERDNAIPLTWELASWTHVVWDLNSWSSNNRANNFLTEYCPIPGLLQRTLRWPVSCVLFKSIRSENIRQYLMWWPFFFSETIVFLTLTKL